MKKKIQSERQYLSQTDVPSISVSEAMRVPQALADNYAGQPTRPLAVAQAMGMSPTSGPFRAICGAAIAYGLTEGGCNAPTIALTDLGRRLVKPVDEGDDANALREATLKPRVLGEFLRKYDGSKLPKQVIAKNVLESMGVPATHLERVYNLIIESAPATGFLREIKGEQYVDLNGAGAITEAPDHEEALGKTERQPQILQSLKMEPKAEKPVNQTNHQNGSAAAIFQNTPGPQEKRRVFITHGKNRSLVPQLKQLLELVDFEAVVAVETDSLAIAVADKVIDSLQSCSAAIIHVEAERTLTDENGNPEKIINPNVLIEIGAALASYRKRIILLVQEGVQLPSNLQGLFEFRYSGQSLDSESTIRLFKVFKDMRHEPTRGAQIHTGQRTRDLGAPAQVQ